MRPVLWRWMERGLELRIADQHLPSVLGDLLEDFQERCETSGRMRAEAWLISEYVSLTRVYPRRQPAGHRRISIGEITVTDAHYALRRLLLRPAASIASVVTLAFAIAAGATTWTLISHVLLDPVPVSSPDELVVVGEERQLRDGSFSPSAVSHIYSTLERVKATEAFERVIAAGAPGTSWKRLVKVGAEAERPRGVHFVTHDYFSVLGVPMSLGTGFAPDHDRRGAPVAAVLSDRYWRAEFQADPGVLGRTIAIAGTEATIVGVSATAFRGLSLSEAPDIFLPLHTVRQIADSGWNYFAEPESETLSSPTAWITVIGRRRSGVSTSVTLERLNASEGPAHSRFSLIDIRVAAIPEAARAGMSEFSRLLAAGVGLLVLIGVLTVGMLVLIRTESRRAEFAMCLALGAGRARLARSVALEGAWLALAGGVLALPVASWLIGGLRSFQLPGRVSIGDLGLGLTSSVLWSTAAIALAATVLISLVAGVFGFSPLVSQALRSPSGATPRLTRRHTRAALLTAQVAVALVLVAGAALFGRSLAAALSLNPAFETDRLVAGSLDSGRHGYTPLRSTVFFDEFMTRLRRAPGIAGVSAWRSVGAMSASGQIKIDGELHHPPSTVWFTAVDENYFNTIGMRIIEGRVFSRGERDAVIVSQSLGRLIARGGSAVGHHIASSPSRPPRVVVGVVPDLVTNVTTLEPLALYTPLAIEKPQSSISFTLRAEAESNAAMETATNLIRELDPAIVPGAMTTLREQIGRQMGPQQLGASVLGALGAMAVLLTILGSYVLAESMAIARRREIGVRAALGATRSQLGALILRDTAKLVITGLIAGVLLAWMLSGLIRSFLFGVAPLDVSTLATTAAAILTVTVGVTLKPAISVARQNLARTLREE